MILRRLWASLWSIVARSCAKQTLILSGAKHSPPSLSQSAPSGKIRGSHFFCVMAPSSTTLLLLCQSKPWFRKMVLFRKFYHIMMYLRVYPKRWTKLIIFSSGSKMSILWNLKSQIFDISAILRGLWASFWSIVARRCGKANIDIEWCEALSFVSFSEGPFGQNLRISLFLLSEISDFWDFGDSPGPLSIILKHCDAPLRKSKHWY